MRYDQFIGDTRESEVLPNRFTFSEIANGVKYGECSDGKADPRLVYGEVQNWKDISPRVGVAWDVFGNGRTAVKASLARYVAGQQVAVARQFNPAEVADAHRHASVDATSIGNGLPFDANGNLQLERARHVDVDGHVRPQRLHDVATTPAVLNGWGKRGYNDEWTIAAQHQLFDRVSVNGGYFRRSFGNQTFTDDLRFDAELATTRSASTRRPIPGCPAAAAIRCAASPT